jgi:hypothetical protein
MSFISVSATLAPAAISAAVVAADEVVGDTVLMTVVGVVDLFIITNATTATPPTNSRTVPVSIAPTFFLFLAMFKTLRAFPAKTGIALDY